MPGGARQIVIQDVKVTKDMLNFAKHIVNQRSSRFDPEKDRYETALIDLINQKRAGNPITPKELPAANNVVGLMEVPRQSVSNEAAPAKGAKKPRKAASGALDQIAPRRPTIGCRPSRLNASTCNHCSRSARAWAPDDHISASSRGSSI